jgi:hypothetical protein
MRFAMGTMGKIVDRRLPQLVVARRKVVLKARTLTVAAFALLGLSAVGAPKAHAQQGFSTIAIEKCGRVVLGSGKDAQAAERDARYRCRVRGGWDCNHLVAPATVPSPNGEHCAAIATHRLGICHFVAKVSFGSSEEDAKKKAVQLCGGASAGHGCQVRPSHWICQ